MACHLPFMVYNYKVESKLLLLELLLDDDALFPFLLLLVVWDTDKSIQLIRTSNNGEHCCIIYWMESQNIQLSLDGTTLSLCSNYSELGHRLNKCQIPIIEMTEALRKKRKEAKDRWKEKAASTSRQSRTTKLAPTSATEPAPAPTICSSPYNRTCSSTCTILVPISYTPNELGKSPRNPTQPLIAYTNSSSLN